MGSIKYHSFWTLSPNFSLQIQVRPSNSLILPSSTFNFMFFLNNFFPQRNCFLLIRNFFVIFFIENFGIFLLFFLWLNRPDLWLDRPLIDYSREIVIYTFLLEFWGWFELWATENVNKLWIKLQGVPPRAGASNLWPRNIFVRPNLDSEFKEKSVFWPIFFRFLIDCGPKYEKKADLRPKDQLGLDAPALGDTKFQKMNRQI